jgi:hypothetical protein
MVLSELPLRQKVQELLMGIPGPSLLIPSHVQEPLDWYFQELHRPDIQDPDLGRVERVGHIELFPHCQSALLDRATPTLGIGVGIHPSVISRMANIIGMIVDTCTTFMLHVPWLDRHEISIVVVGEENRH